MGKMFVFSNPVDGRDAEFNAWYDGVHSKDVVGTPPFVSCTRYRVTEVEGLPPGPPHRYLAVYEYNGPAQAASDSLSAAAEHMHISDSLDPDVLVVFAEEFGGGR